MPRRRPRLTPTDIGALVARHVDEPTLRAFLTAYAALDDPAERRRVVLQAQRTPTTDPAADLRGFFQRAARLAKAARR